jgi:4-alpha-glucanotransferase
MPSDPAPRRSGGVLLHPTSLPGPYGIGDLGPTAHAWIDALARAKQTWWQVLPLGPTGYGDSPYQSYSSFAGNLNLLSPELLVQEGLLRRSDLDGVHFPDGRVDYQNVIPFKQHLLERAWGEFKALIVDEEGLRDLFEEFCRREAGWLDDFALFMAIKSSQGGASWQEWPAGPPPGVSWPTPWVASSSASSCSPGSGRRSSGTPTTPASS